MTGEVYIAQISKVLGREYELEEALGYILQSPLMSDYIRSRTDRMAKKVGIRKRVSVLDPNVYPERRRLEDCSPEVWGKELLAALPTASRQQLGFLALTYNVSSDVNPIPNLAARLAGDLNLQELPLELPYYGCAGGMVALQKATDFCRKHQKPAFVYVFDQCSWQLPVLEDPSHPDFKSNLRLSLLFADGGAGILLIPESMRENWQGNLWKIFDIQTAFSSGSQIRMEKGVLTLDSGLRDEIPGLASSFTKKMIHNQGLSLKDIPTWAIHQGGKPILKAFLKEENLHLSDKQLQDSLDLFSEYGNFSAASVFMVMEKQFKQQKAPKEKGFALSFGAGYYLGGLLYEQC